MKKKSIDKDVIVLLITTLITIVVWVGLDVYRAYLKVEMPTGLEKHLNTLSPVLKTSVFERIESRSQ